MNTLTLSIDGPVASLSLNRPESLNALSPQLVAEFALALRTIERLAEVRALIVSGAGRAFCAGADLKSVSSSVGNSDRDN